VPMNSAKSFCIRLYTNRLRLSVGAAAPERGISECGGILLDCNRPVKESDIEEQPCLIVVHLKVNEGREQSAHWAIAETDSHFSNLTVK
jgi:hypothetical protein